MQTEFDTTTHFAAKGRVILVEGDDAVGARMVAGQCGLRMLG
jgi:hypothetical protein